MPRKPNTATRERIVEEGHDLMYCAGYKGASMDDVAEAAGVKKANLFHYYPTKEALGLAVFEYATRGFAEKLAMKLGDGSDPLQFVAAMLEDTFSRMRRCEC